MIDGLVSASVLQTLIVAILAAAVGAGLSALGLVLLTRSGIQRTAAHVVFWEIKRYERHTDAAIKAAQGSDRYKATKNNEEGPLRSEDVVAAVLFRNRPSLSSSFQQASAELLATDPELALYLSAFQSFHDSAEKMLSLCERIEDALLFGEIDEPPRYFLGYLRSGLGHARNAMETGDSIAELISRLWMGGTSGSLRRAYRRVFRRRTLRKVARKQRERAAERNTDP